MSVSVSVRLVRRRGQPFTQVQLVSIAVHKQVQGASGMRSSGVAMGM